MINTDMMFLSFMAIIIGTSVWTCVYDIDLLKARIAEIGISLSYNLLYAFSVFQIQSQKWSKILRKYTAEPLHEIHDRLEKGPCISLTVRIYDKEYMEQHALTLKDMDALSPDYLESLIYDKQNVYFVLSYKCQHSNTIHYVCSEKVFEYLRRDPVPSLHDIAESKFRFMMLDLTIGDETYAIKLNGPSYSYYIIGNFLNRNFFKYYLKNVLNVDIPKKFEYNAHMLYLDENGNVVSNNFTHNDSLIIKEYEYEIVRVVSDSVNDPKNVTNESTSSEDTDCLMVDKECESKNENKSILNPLGWFRKQ